MEGRNEENYRCQSLLREQMVFVSIFLFFVLFFFRMKDLERVVMSNVCGIQSIGKVKLTRVWFCIMLSVFYSTNF